MLLHNYIVLKNFHNFAPGAFNQILIFIRAALIAYRHFLIVARSRLDNNVSPFYSGEKGEGSQ